MKKAILLVTFCHLFLISCYPRDAVVMTFTPIPSPSSTPDFCPESSLRIWSNHFDSIVEDSLMGVSLFNDCPDTECRMRMSDTHKNFSEYLDRVNPPPCAKVLHGLLRQYLEDESRMLQYLSSYESSSPDIVKLMDELERRWDLIGIYFPQLRDNGYDESFANSMDRISIEETQIPAVNIRPPTEELSTEISENPTSTKSETDSLNNRESFNDDEIIWVLRDFFEGIQLQPEFHEGESYIDDYWDSIEIVILDQKLVFFLEEEIWEKEIAYGLAIDLMIGVIVNGKHEQSNRFLWDFDSIHVVFPYYYSEIYNDIYVDFEGIQAVCNDSTKILDSLKYSESPNYTIEYYGK